MSPRAAAALAWSVLGVFAVLQVLTLWLIWRGPATGDQAFGVLMLGYATVGALVAARRPGNAVGWLLLATAVSFAVQALAEAYAWTPSYPGYLFFAWLAAWVWCVPVMLAAIFLPLLFPDGRLLSGRWRPLVWLGMGALATSIVGQAVKPGDMGLEAPGAPTNPFGAPERAGGLIDALLSAAYLLAAVAFLLAVTSLVLRFRRARGAARQQLKWIAVVGLLTFGAIAVGVSGALLPVGAWHDTSNDVTYVALLVIFVLGIPAATGIAILRHRLYDIDVVINRTLVYGSLTAILAATYLCTVLLLRLVLDPVTRHSDLAVAGSTLAVAALVRPLRFHIQSAVDRRFYRARYDAGRTLKAFSDRLRDELDLETLDADIRRVAQDTLHPTSVSLWLRKASR